jgi:hypothetical protein
MSALRLQHPVSGASRGEWMSYMNHCNVVANIALALMHDPCGHRPHEDPALDDSDPDERQEEQCRRADLALEFYLTRSSAEVESTDGATRDEARGIAASGTDPWSGSSHGDGFPD